ncbi:MAG: MFS transporter [Pseudomonadota bacterium]|jgi:MFS family permease|nr:MFS transporter [Pseudomonadota bacterium]
MPDKGTYRRIVWPFAIAETIIWAAIYYSFPALLLTWEQDLGWSKMELTGAFTAALIVNALCAPMVGRLIDRGYGRFVFMGSMLLGAALLCVLSIVTQIWQFYAVWIAIGAAMAGCMYEPCFAIMTRSFQKDAKRAITLVTLVAGLAGTVSFPSAHALVEMMGWRMTVLVFAAVMVITTGPLVWIGCRAADRMAEGRAFVPSEKTQHALRILKTFAFWALALSFAMLALHHGMMINHILPIFDERGIAKETAVLAISMIGPMQVAGRLVMMAAERYVSTMVISACCFIAVFGASTALLGTSVMPSLIAIFVLLQGAGNGVVSIVRPVLIATLLSRRNFGAVSGMAATAFMAGTAFGPTFGSLIWEIGGYDLVINLAIAMPLVGLILLLAAARYPSSVSDDDPE